MTQKDSAKDLIKGMCANREVPASKILEAGEQLGIHADALHHASVELNVIKEKPGLSEGWTWRMPPAVQDVHVAKVPCTKCGRSTVDEVTTEVAGGTTQTARANWCAACEEQAKADRAARREKARAKLRRRIQGHGDGALNPATPDELRTFDELPWRQAKTYASGILMRPASGDATRDLEATRGAVKWQEPA